MGWRRTFWAVWAANLVTSIGMMSFLPFFPGLLEELGVEGEARVATWAGLLFAAAPLSATLMSPIWGALGDRLGRKLMVVRAMLAIAVFVGAMGLATGPWQLLLLRTLQGVFSGFIPPSITLVSVAAPAERQGRVVADLQTALPLGAVVGPLIGGLIAAALGRRQVFLFVAAAALLGALLVMLLAREDATSRQARSERFSMGEMWRGTRGDLREVWRNPVLRSAIVLLFCLQFGLGGTNPVLELHVGVLVEGGGPGWLARLSELPGLSGGEGGARALATSFLFGAMALANFVAIPIWGRLGDRFGAAPALLVAAGGSALSLLVQAASPAYGGLLAGRVLMGVAMAGAAPLVFGVAASETAIERRGGAFGAVFSARAFAVALSGAVGGALASLVGIRGVMLIAALFTGAAALRFQLRARRRA